MENRILNVEQLEAYNILSDGRNVFLTGEAGTGKSFLLNFFISHNSDKKIVKCAPTGIAAINIKGSTVHRVFGAPVGIIQPDEYNRKPSEALKNAEIVIIDEISMCRRDLFDYAMNTLTNLHDGKKRQVIVVGDFFQLPPVILSDEESILCEIWKDKNFGKGYACSSDLWGKMEFYPIVLNEVMRQKDEKDFLSNLNKIRRGLPRGIDWINENSAKEAIDGAVCLCGTNKKAEEINAAEINKIDEKEMLFVAEQIGTVEELDKPTTDEVIIKKGMRIMTLINNLRDGYQNGTVATVADFDENEILIQLANGKRCVVKKYEWEIYDYEFSDGNLVKKTIGKYIQIPIKPAYAITIHKSQGQTYEEANIDPECFERGQLYVALSRIKDVNRLYLKKKIHRWDLKVDDEIKMFYRKLGG